jgi:hypothetical protein
VSPSAPAEFAGITGLCAKKYQRGGCAPRGVTPMRIYPSLDSEFSAVFSVASWVSEAGYPQPVFAAAAKANPKDG